MITSVSIKNFRSIESMELSLGKINVLTGANNSGKSSVIYALLSLNNAIEKQNQPIDSIFDLGFIDLGGYKQVVYRKRDRNAIGVFIRILEKTKDVKYGLEIASFGVIANLEIPEFSLVTRYMQAWPIQNNEKIELESDSLPDSHTFLWDGFTAEMVKKKRQALDATSETPNAFPIDYQKRVSIARRVVDMANSPFDEINSIQNVPINRGFTKARFSPMPSTGLLNTEGELATLLYNDRELAGIVAYYLKKIVDRQFAVVPVANTTNFYLQTQDEETGFTADLVNEGLGTNQLVAILTKALYEHASFICIDEPEIHLHPSIIDKLVNVLIDIANERGKQFLISTHSEHFVTTLMTAVVKKRIAPEELKIYHLTKEGWDTKAEEQVVNEQGQLSNGGLSHFYTTELTNIAAFFGLDKE